MAEQQQDSFQELLSTLQETNEGLIENNQDQELLLQDIASSSQSQQAIQNITASSIDNLLPPSQNLQNLTESILSTQLNSTTNLNNIVKNTSDIPPDITTIRNIQQGTFNLTNNIDVLTAQIVATHTKQLEEVRRTSRNISTLVTSDLTNQLGTGQYDEQMNVALHEIDIAQDQQKALSPEIHQTLLTQIKEALRAGQLSFKERFSRFFTNNIKVFGNLGDLTARIFGANIFEQKRAQKEREASERGRVLQEENYDLNYLTYKFMVTEQVVELRAQTDAIELLVRRTPSLAQQEEERRERLRRERAASFALPDDKRQSTLDQEPEQEGMLSRIGTSLIATIAGTATGATIAAKLANMKTQVKGKVTGMTKGFIGKVFGLGKFAKVAGPIGAIASAIATGVDIFDIANAMTDEDIRTHVKGRDIGGVVGSIIGGAVGFALGGPAGLAIGVGIGNTIGEFVGKIAETQEVQDALTTVKAKLQEQLLTATGANKKRIEDELARLIKVDETTGAELRLLDKELTTLYDKRIKLSTDLQAARAENNTKEIERIVALQTRLMSDISKTEQEYLKKEKQLEAESKAASKTMLLEMSSILDTMANTSNPFIKWFAETIGGDARADIRVAKIEEEERELQHKIYLQERNRLKDFMKQEVEMKKVGAKEMEHLQERNKKQFQKELEMSVIAEKDPDRIVDRQSIWNETTEKWEMTDITATDRLKQIQKVREDFIQETLDFKAQRESNLAVQLDALKKSFEAGEASTWTNFNTKQAGLATKNIQKLTDTLKELKIEREGLEQAIKASGGNSTLSNIDSHDATFFRQGDTTSIFAPDRTITGDQALANQK